MDNTMQIWVADDDDDDDEGREGKKSAHAHKMPWLDVHSNLSADTESFLAWIKLIAISSSGNDIILKTISN